MKTLPTISLNVYQLMALRHLTQNGMEKSMLHYALSRSDCSQADWDAVQAAGLVCERHHKVWLTTVGKKVYRQQSKGKYF